MGQGAVEIRRAKFAAAEASLRASAGRSWRAGPDDVDDPALLGNAYNGRGVARVQQRQMPVRSAGHGRGADRDAALRQPRSKPRRSSSNLGQIETQRGHYPQALQEFDGAIAVFERFDVRDYLASTLMSKAATQLKLAQPADAAASIERADVW